MTPVGVIALGLVAWRLFGVGKTQPLWWVGVGAGCVVLLVLVSLCSSGNYFGEFPFGVLADIVGVGSGAAAMSRVRGDGRSVVQEPPLVCPARGGGHAGFLEWPGEHPDGAADADVFAGVNPTTSGQVEDATVVAGEAVGVTPEVGGTAGGGQRPVGAVAGARPMTAGVAAQFHGLHGQVVHHAAGAHGTAW